MRNFIFFVFAGLFVTLMFYAGFFSDKRVTQEQDDVAVVDCKLKESAALRGCDFVANQMMWASRSAEREAARFKENLDNCTYNLNQLSQELLDCKLKLEP